MPPSSVAPFDEMLDTGDAVRPAYGEFRTWYDEQDGDWLRRQDIEAERFFRRIGITFNVYGDGAGEERLIPFIAEVVRRVDVAARVIEVEWGAEY